MTEPKTMTIMPGGWTETRDADKEAECICDEVRSLVEEKTNKIYQEYRATQYRSQLVNGTNYLFKVCVGGPSYIHLLVYQGFGEHACLKGVQENKTKDDPLEHFEKVCEAWSHTMYTDEETRCISDQLRSLVEGKTNKIYQEYRAVLSRNQLVTGKNLLLKVRVGDRNYIHVQVHQAHPCNGGHLELRGVQEDKTQDEPLEPISD